MCSPGRYRNKMDHNIAAGVVGSSPTLADRRGHISRNVAETQPRKRTKTFCFSGCEVASGRHIYGHVGLWVCSKSGGC
jgi:hypothetical protein